MTQCDNCGTLFESDRYRCPYCGVVNPERRIDPSKGDWYCTTKDNEEEENS
mgnify:FL=1